MLLTGSIPIIVCDEQACENSGLTGVAVGVGVAGIEVGVGEGGAEAGGARAALRTESVWRATHFAALKAPPGPSPELVNGKKGGFRTST